MPKNLRLNLFLLLMFCTVMAACSSSRQIAKTINTQIKSSGVLNGYNFGFAVYDLSAEKMVFEHNAAQYFIPASNTKLLTFYAGLKVLPDSLPAIRYEQRGDSLIFWGTGDPSLLHTQLGNRKVLDFLAGTNKKLYLSHNRYKGEFYGKGWQWDDYNDYYQAEINEFPIADNLVDVKVERGVLKVSPKYFSLQLKADSTMLAEPFMIKRDFLKNEFRYSAFNQPEGYQQKIPFKVNAEVAASILADTLKKSIELINLPMPAMAKTLRSVSIKPVLKEMMVPSDNFIAEQLLLVYADKLGIAMDADTVIAYLRRKYLGQLPDKPVWKDASGLSRYNLITPRSVVKLLELISEEFDEPAALYDMLPAGGATGTLKNAYPATKQPYVFGKTGSMSNVYNQSGYLVTKKGKTFLFSFLNNNFTVPNAEVRKEIARIITGIYEKY